MGSYFIARISTGSFFSSNKFSYNMVPLVRNIISKLFLLERRGTITFENYLLAKNTSQDIRSIKYVTQEITVRNKFPSEDILTGGCFLTSIPGERCGTIFL
jgi:hypothetical protein